MKPLKPYKRNFLEFFFMYMSLIIIALLLLEIINISIKSSNILESSRDFFKEKEDNLNIEERKVLDRNLLKYLCVFDYSRIEVYNKDLELETVIPLYVTSPDIRKLRDQTKKSRDILKYFNTYDYGHTTIKLDESNELDFYFIKNENETDNYYTFTLFYDIRKIKYSKNYIVQICFIILFINFWIFLKNLNKNTYKRMGNR